MKKRLSSLALALVLCLGLASPAVAAGQTFSDVPTSFWAYEAIEYVVDKGLFNGTSATTFTPNATMTRAMLTEILYRYAGSPAVSGTVESKTTFRDVPADAYYADAVIWGVEHKIFPMWFTHTSRMVADVATEFKPNAVVNRAEFTTMLSSFTREVLWDKPNASDTNLDDIIDYCSNKDTCQFKDMTSAAIYKSMPEISSYAVEHDIVYGIINTMIGWAYHEGILTGTSATTMSPSGTITRAQVAAMLMRYHQKFGEPPASEKPKLNYKITLTELASEFKVGESDLLIAVADAEEYVTFTCASSAPEIMTVVPVEFGAQNKWELSAVSPGTATITVTDSNGKTASVTITVSGEQSGNGSASTNSMANEVVRLVNEERAARGLPALQTADNIMAAAQTRAEELPQLVEHTRPDGRHCLTALDDAGVQYEIAGENIAAGYPSPEMVVDGWMHSDGHRSNILNSNFTSIGVGYVHADSGRGDYWVQLFIG